MTDGRTSSTMTRADLNTVARTWIEQGDSFRIIRRRFAMMGIRWTYSFSGSVKVQTSPTGFRLARASHQGGRQRLRQLRSAKLCMTGDGRSTHGSGIGLCLDCLTAKWGSANAAGYSNAGAPLSPDREYRP